MSTPTETVAEALTDLHYGHQDEEAYAELLREGIFFKDAKAALTSLAQHRDDIARVLHDVECSARCESGPGHASYKRADAVLAYLTKEEV